MLATALVFRGLGVLELWVRFEDLEINLGRILSIELSLVLHSSGHLLEMKVSQTPL